MNINVRINNLKKIIIIYEFEYEYIYWLIKKKYIFILFLFDIIIKYYYLIY